MEFALDGEEGVQKVTRNSYDLVVLDIMLPLKNGYDVCRDIRTAGVVVPILMVTTGGKTVNKVLGLKLGADDYLIKPFDAMELLARIEALLRGVNAPAAGVDRFGSLQIDLCAVCREARWPLSFESSNC